MNAGGEFLHGVEVSLSVSQLWRCSNRLIRMDVRSVHTDHLAVSSSSMLGVFPQRGLFMKNRKRVRSVCKPSLSLWPPFAFKKLPLEKKKKRRNPRVIVFEFQEGNHFPEGSYVFGSVPMDPFHERFFIFSLSLLSFFFFFYQDASTKP